MGGEQKASHKMYYFSEAHGLEKRGVLQKYLKKTIVIEKRGKLY